MCCAGVSCAVGKRLGSVLPDGRGDGSVLGLLLMVGS